MSFWIIVAALLLLALVILLVPMLRSRGDAAIDQRQQQNIQIAKEKKAVLDAQLADGDIDQAAFDAAYLDLQNALALELDPAESKQEMARGSWMSVVVLLIVPVASVSLYLLYGEYRVIENPALVEAAPSQQNAAPQMSLEEMIAVIEERIANNPEDAEAWFMLGRANMSRQQFGEAVKAFGQANQILVNEPGIMFALADAMAMQNNGLLTGEPEALVLRGLQIAPRFPNGLWLAGMGAEQRGDFAGAHRYWSLLLPMVEENPQSANEIRQMLASLEARDPSLAQPASTPSATVAAPKITLRIDIDSALREQADPATAVFVYAKAMQGPPMPLAVKRLQLGDLPATLSLGDADAMMPSMKLSSFDQVIVGARVSFSGNPVAQTGDFYTEQDSVDSNNPPSQIDLTIDQVK